MTADEQLVTEAFRAIAFELGTVAWAADVDLTVLGDLDELAGVFEQDRLRYVPRLDPTTRGQIEFAATTGAAAILDADCSLSRSRRSICVAAATRWSPMGGEPWTLISTSLATRTRPCCPTSSS